MLDSEGNEDGSCSSDETGCFTCATSLRQATLKVEVDGFAPLCWRLALSPGEKRRVTIPLVATGRLAGRLVSAATGEPVGHGEVRVESAGAMDPGAVERWTEVDAQGEFEWDDMAEGTFRLTARVSGHRLADSDEITIKSGKTTTVELKLEPAQGILSTVSRAGSGAPDVPVTARHLAAGTVARSMTNRVGDFELLGLEPGEHELRAGPDPVDPGENVVAARLEVSAGETTHEDLDLSSVLLDGQVTGESAPELRIRVLRVTPCSWSGAETTKKDGRFSLVLPGSGDYLLEILRGDESLAREALTVPEGASRVHPNLTLPE